MKSIVWRPFDYLFAIHPTQFTWLPKIHWQKGWRSFWWLWFEASWACSHCLVFMGGASAACDRDCQCSVPVYECKFCGACDYGDNAEATYIRSQCDVRVRLQESAEPWPQ